MWQAGGKKSSGLRAQGAGRGAEGRGQRAEGRGRRAQSGEQMKHEASSGAEK